MIPATPWRVIEVHVEDDPCYAIVGKDGEPVALFPGVYKDKTTIDFIVRVCNAHGSESLPEVQL